MDIRNSSTLATIDNTPVVQLNNLSGRIGRFFDARSLVDEQAEELTEMNYCPLPEYCLIEDKWKYLAGLFK